MNAITDPSVIKAELQRRLLKRPAPQYGMRPALPRVSCADGFTVSVQAGYGIYCSPRTNEGPWSAVELGFPSASMPELADYIDGGNINDTDTVWGYVPLQRVAEVLAAHGGLLPQGEG